MESLRYFITVAQMQSLHKASEALHITQPALSKSIRHLEEELGAALFIRSAKGMTLTDIGRLTLERAMPVYEQWRDFCDEVRAVIHGAAIQLGTLPSLAAYYLPQRMTKQTPTSAMRQSPSIGGLTVYNTTAEGLRALKQGDIDALVGQTNTQAEPPLFWHRELFVEPYLAVTSALHPLAKCEMVSLYDVSSYPIIAHPSGCDVRSAVFDAFSTLDLRPEVAMEVPFNESLLGFVGAGVGVAIVPALLGDQAIRMGLRVYPLSDVGPFRQISILARNAQVGRALANWLTPSPSTAPQEKPV